MKDNLIAEPCTAAIATFLHIHPMIPRSETPGCSPLSALTLEVSVSIVKPAEAAAFTMGSNCLGAGVGCRRRREQEAKCWTIFSATEMLARSIISSTIWFASRTCRSDKYKKQEVHFYSVSEANYLYCSLLQNTKILVLTHSFTGKRMGQPNPTPGAHAPSPPSPLPTWYIPTSRGFRVSVSIVNLTSGEASCRAPRSPRRRRRIWGVRGWERRKKLGGRCRDGEAGRQRGRREASGFGLGPR